METRPVAASLSILTAMLIVGFIDSFVAVIAAEGAGVWQFHLTRSAMALPLLGVFAWLGFGRLRPAHWPGVIGRSAAMTVSMVLYYAALGVLPIAQVVAGFFTAPIFVLVLSALFLGQRIGPWRIGAAVAGFAGVLLILRPDPAALSVWTAVPILAGFFYAVTAIATRTWCRGEDAATLVAWGFVGLGLAGALGIGVLAAMPVETAGRADAFLVTGWVAPGGTFVLWTAVQAVGSLAAVLFIVRAYQMGEASYVGIFEYSLLVFVAIWAFVLFGEGVDALSALGMVLIIGSGAVIAIRSRRAAAVPTAPRRRPDRRDASRAGTGGAVPPPPVPGGTSMALALEARAMKDDILIGDTPKARRRRGRLKDVRTAGRLWKHSRLSDIAGLLPEEDFAQMLVFTMVRNPWDRMVSYYHWLRVQRFDHPAVRLAGAVGLQRLPEPSRDAGQLRAGALWRLCRLRGGHRV
jgi:drug/metabolite transporter (DMT)-like permease